MCVGGDRWESCESPNFRWCCWCCSSVGRAGRGGCWTLGKKVPSTAPPGATLTQSREGGEEAHGVGLGWLPECPGTLRLYVPMWKDGAGLESWRRTCPWGWGRTEQTPPPPSTTPTVHWLPLRQDVQRGFCGWPSVGAEEDMREGRERAELAGPGSACLQGEQGLIPTPWLTAGHSVTS